MKALILLLFAACCSTAAPSPSHNKEFFTVCWDKGNAVYTHVCAEPEIIHWDKVPLRVWTDEANLWATSAATDVWNVWLGFEMFRLTDSEYDADVSVSYAGTSLFYLGLTKFEKTSGRLHSYVEIFTGAVNNAETMTHELGHVLGLEHDENRRSIMFPYARRVMPTLESVDQFWIQQLYRRKAQRAFQMVP